MTEEKVSVLYVDDEENNLISFRSIFRKCFNVYTAISAESGRAILKENIIHCIVADQRMPGTTGVEFLESVVKEYPDATRMLLTGYTDIESVISAINKGQVYKYLTKPWEEENLKVMINDAFEKYQANFLLGKKAQGLEKEQQELDRFAYSTSHDLRAPLTSIMGIVNVAKSESQINDEYLTMIEKMVKKLDAFTKSIIDHYKNSKTELQTKPVDFKSLINDLTEYIKMFRDATMVDFVVNVKQDEPFSADEFRIKIILNNLISNAINYRDKNKGKVIIEINALIENGRALIFVKDNGSGISSQHLEHIFNMFYRASTDNNGSGLGLYVVKEAIDKMHGTISVNSIVGEGTSFEIMIPG